MADLGDYKSCMIVHITDKGKVEFLKGKISDSYISFDAAEFFFLRNRRIYGRFRRDTFRAGKEETGMAVDRDRRSALILVVILGGVQIADSRRKKRRIKVKNKNE